MSSDLNEKKENDRSKLLVLLLFLGAGGMLFTYALSGTGPSSSQQKVPAVVQSAKFEKAVNRNLMITNDSLEFERKKVELENARTARDFDTTSAQPTYAPPVEGAELNQENSSQEIANMLGRGERKTDEPLNPDQIIQKELFNRQQMEEYSAAYKKEYARQFVENARRGGYKVQLNEDFKVISVVPIRKPSYNGNENILNPDGGGIQ